VAAGVRKNEGFVMDESLIHPDYQLTGIAPRVGHSLKKIVSDTEISSDPRLIAQHILTTGDHHVLPILADALDETGHPAANDLDWRHAPRAIALDRAFENRLASARDLLGVRAASPFHITGSGLNAVDLMRGWHRQALRGRGIPSIGGISRRSMLNSLKSVNSDANIHDLWHAAGRSTDRDKIRQLAFHAANNRDIPVHEIPYVMPDWQLQDYRREDYQKVLDNHLLSNGIVPHSEYAISRPDGIKPLPFKYPDTRPVVRPRGRPRKLARLLERIKLSRKRKVSEDDFPGLMKTNLSSFRERLEFSRSSFEEFATKAPVEDVIIQAKKAADMRLPRKDEEPEDTASYRWTDRSEKSWRKRHEKNGFYRVDMPITLLNTNSGEVVPERQARLDKAGGSDDPIFVGIDSNNGDVIKAVFNVDDGNNRVAWAKNNGKKTVPAFVTPNADWHLQYLFDQLSQSDSRKLEEPERLRRLRERIKRARKRGVDDFPGLLRMARSEPVQPKPLPADAEIKPSQGDSVVLETFEAGDVVDTSIAFARDPSKFPVNRFSRPSPVEQE
jgi:hypothetical protein